MEKKHQHKYHLSVPGNVADIYEKLGDVDLLYNHLEYNPHPVLITDKLGTIVYVNEKMLELTKYKRTELIGNKPSLFKSGAQPREFYDRLWQSIEKGQTYESRFKNRRKNGEVFWVYSAIKPLKNENGEISGYISIQEDITNLVKLETQPAKSELVLANLVRNLPKTGIILIENHPFSVNMAEGELIYEYFPDKKPDIDDFYTFFNSKSFNLKHQLEKVSKSQNAFRKKVSLNSRTFDFNISPLTFGESSKKYSIVIIRDVSDYQYIIEKVQSSEQRLEAIFQNAGIGIGILNTDGEYIRMNSAWAQMTGYSQQELLTKNVRELIYADDLHLYRPELQRLIKGVFVSQRFEMRFLKKNGEVLWGDVSLSSIKNRNGVVEAIIAVVSDISEAKIAYEALEHSQQKFKNLSETKDRLFSILAHDLKNPFGSIIGLSELAIEDPQNYTKDKALDFLNSINQTANQAYNLLQNLLEWSRVQTGHISPVLVHIDLHEIVSEAVELVHTMANNKKLDIHSTVPAESFAICDVEMINTIVRNLLSNAIKYSNAESSIDITTREKDKYLVLTIRDHGIGMSKEMQEKIITTNNIMSAPGTENEKGTGLGLNLVKDFIALNHGKLKIESNEGEGSAFHVFLPRTSGN